MSKEKKGIIISVVLVIIVLAIVLSVSLTVGSVENRTIRKLTDLRYDVMKNYCRVYIEYGKSYYEVISAEKVNVGSSNDYVDVYIFKNKSDATMWYGKLSSNKSKEERVVQKGKTIYYGTYRAISDLRVY